MDRRFEQWLDEILQEALPEEAVAVNFNIYEEEDSEWSMQLIAADSFSEENDDWACEEVFSSEENLYTWKQDGDWMESLQSAIEMIQEYMEEGEYGEKLKEYTAVCAGLVDGDIEIIYTQDEE